eukprot:gnl/TRDRNA2_/TRDRNA2_30870_c0_seq1.p1 gnl/TRDRNA2_/TRDRNA2_30870_c0~~gnl/TRDRNA2_/TRDRNA2_30870_c0_seq1.p1  ORF type:complete len:388 (-),score=65.87 gnl/TRDRNA2_/TRDRNA2_30870_c0_seq1:78-1196(-)
MAREDAAAVVIDSGGFECKAGFSGDDAPKVVFPALVGRPRVASALQVQDAHDASVGLEAQARRGILSLRYPMHHGVVVDWEDMERIWNYMFHKELRVAPEEHPVLLTEAPLNPKVNRERLVEVFFEKFSVPAMYVAIQGVLSLYASGRTTGLALDVGDGLAHTVPVFDGYAFPHGILRLELAGRELTEFMVQELSQRGCKLQTTAEREIAREVKDKLSYVAIDYEAELRANRRPRPYELPDGTQIFVGDEAFRVPEVLFRPSLLGRDGVGVHEFVSQSVAQCDIDVRRELYGNIVLSGGTTMTSGFVDRFSKELSSLTPASSKGKVVAPPERKYSPWIGGSVLSALSTFRGLWITRQEYAEVGAAVGHQRCL